MRLYFHPISGHAHRARLFLSLLGVEAELVQMNLGQGEHKSEAFLAKNRFGQIPVLEDGDHVVADSNAILVYLATKLERSDWYPSSAYEAAQVQRWLSVAAGQLAYGPAAARLVTLFGANFSPDVVIERAHALFAILEAELSAREWLVASRPTIADVAMYSYIDRAPEGNVDLDGYPNLRSYLERIESLPGFVAFDKSPVGLEKA